MRRLSRLSRSIDGRRALITGAASGMGRATAYLMADEGAQLALVDRSPEVQKVASEIKEAGGNAMAFEADLERAETIAPLVAEVAGRLGGLEIVVNNAGISLPITISDPDYDAAWATTMAVNLNAYVLIVRAALPYLLEDGAGRIVNIASTEGLGATAMVSPYTASKHGVVGLTRALAVELGPSGVTVNCVCPGPILTGMTDAIPDAARTKFARRRVPIRRYGEPEEVAHMTLSLVLPAASFITGAVVPVDGGLTVQNT